MKQVLLLSILLSASTAFGDDAPRARDLGIPFDGTPGYRTLSNAGADAAQEVPHYHLHILAGGPLGPMLMRAGSRSPKRLRRRESLSRRC